MDKKNFALFDFDGVIADSFSVAIDVERMGCPDMTDDEYRQLFDGNINDAEHAHNANCRTNFDFFKYYIPRMKKEVKPVPGIDTAIKIISKNCALSIVSSTIISPIEDFIKNTALRNILWT